MSTKTEYLIYFPELDQNDTHVRLRQALEAAGITVIDTPDPDSSPDALVTWFHGHGRVTETIHSLLRKYDCPMIGIEWPESGKKLDPVVIFDLQLNCDTPYTVLAHAIYSQILMDRSRQKLKNARARLNHRRAKLDEVVTLGMRLTGTLSHHDLFQLVVDHAASLLPAHAHAFFTIDTDGSNCRLRAVQYEPGCDEQKILPSFRVHPEIRQALNTLQKPLPAQYPFRDPPWIHHLAIHFIWAQSLLITPILSKQHLLGFLVTAHRQENQTYSDADMERLEVLAAFSSVSIGNAFVYERTETLSRIDELTGVYNFGFIQNYLDRLVKANESFSLVFIDLDGFKDINLRYGHKTGNKALRNAAVKITDTLTPYSLCGRFGGDEFVIVMPGTAAEDAQNRTETAIRSIEMILINSTIRLSASAGIAEYPSDAHDLNSIIHAADTAMYAAKELGRGHVLLFSNL
jgi:diguanylate cyclase (GGDEF)-like protein